MTLTLSGGVVRFADPAVLALLLVVPALAYLTVRRERARSGALLFPALSLLPARRSVWRRRLRPALLVLRSLALALLIAGLARPQAVRASEVPAEGVDIAIVVDLSGSMTQTGFGGPSITKIDAVKEVVGDFVGGLEDDRVGLVVFGSEALVLSPLTLDHAAVRELARPLQADGSLVGASTAIGTGLATGLNVLRASEARSKVAILLTDGENNTGEISPADAARAARLLGIRVYTIGAVLATERRSGSVPVDEAQLREMASQTGGQYFVASDEQALRRIYDDIARLERSRVGYRTDLASYEDVVLPFLAGGGALLLVEVLLTLTVLRRTP